jgi:hypothetical protein
LPADQGLAVIFALCDEWAHKRQLLALLGAEDPTALDDVLTADTSRRRSSRAERLAADSELGGEVSIVG